MHAIWRGQRYDDTTDTALSGKVKAVGRCTHLPAPFRSHLWRKKVTARIANTRANKIRLHCVLKIARRQEFFCHFESISKMGLYNPSGPRAMRLALYSRRVHDLGQMAFAHDRLIGRAGVGVGELFGEIPLSEELHDELRRQEVDSAESVFAFASSACSASFSVD